MSYIEIDTELLLLAAQDGEHSRGEMMRRLRETTAEERRVLRQAIERLDAALDEVIISKRLERIRERLERIRHNKPTDNTK